MSASLSLSDAIAQATQADANSDYVIIERRGHVGLSESTLI
jgi:hypothetical protein